VQLGAGVQDEWKGNILYKERRKAAAVEQALLSKDSSGKFEKSHPEITHK